MARDVVRYPMERILAAAELASAADPGRLDEVVALLEDEEAVVRYWGCVGCAALGSDAASARAELFLALADPAPSVRVAAADALVRLGAGEAALGTLIALLEDDRDEIRLMAAIVLDEMDEDARPAVAALEAALERGDRIRGPKSNFVKRVVEKALADLGGE